MLILSFIGFCFLLKIIFEVSKSLYTSLFPSKPLQERYGKVSWAVVTGASDGIGKGFANVLAKHGFKICLIARNLQKLEKVKQEIVQQYKETEVKIVAADFQKSLDVGFYDKIYEELKGLDVSILVNNVGVGNSGFFHQDSDEVTDEYILVNILPQMMMTKKLIPKFLKRPIKSAIVNVSSILGGKATPYAAMYTATKAFDDFLSRCLSIEYRNKIDLLSFRPGSVTSQLTFGRKKDLFVTISPEECAEGCLKDLGKRTFSAGHFKHELHRIIIEIVPEWAMFMFIGLVGPFVVRMQYASQKKWKEEQMGKVR